MKTYCLSCPAEIPEGDMVCTQCQKSLNIKSFEQGIKIRGNEVVPRTSDKKRFPIRGKTIV